MVLHHRKSLDSTDFLVEIVRGDVGYEINANKQDNWQTDNVLKCFCNWSFSFWKGYHDDDLLAVGGDMVLLWRATDLNKEGNWRATAAIYRVLTDNFVWKEARQNLYGSILAKISTQKFTKSKPIGHIEFLWRDNSSH